MTVDVHRELLRFFAFAFIILCSLRDSEALCAIVLSSKQIGFDFISLELGVTDITGIAAGFVLQVDGGVETVGDKTETATFFGDCGKFEFPAATGD